MLNALRVVAALALLFSPVAVLAQDTVPPRTNLEGSSNLFPTIDPKSIRKIKCTAGHGTGFVIAKGKMMTAYHVIANQAQCSDEESGEVLIVVYQNPSLDIAVLGFTHTKGSPDALPVRCTAFETTGTYYSYGFAGVGESDMMVTRLRALTDYTDGVDMVSKTPFYHMRILKGVVIQGMSGGPILDDSGRVVGMNNLTAAGYRFGLSREMRDTYLCDAERMKDEQKSRKR
jgi:hypothetical protein